MVDLFLRNYFRRIRLTLRLRSRFRANLPKAIRLYWRGLEIIRYMIVCPREKKLFYIVSSERNAGEAAWKCLNSVYGQKYDRKLIKHIYIDDFSSDITPSIIQRWLTEHPDHNVQYIQNSIRMGGCANNIKGFRMAPRVSIVLELNGDDWLLDSGVINFFNKVYSNDKIWMTYNTPMLADGTVWPELFRPIPINVIKTNAFRSYSPWHTSHPHTFRREILDYVKEESLIDPSTGRYWESADDVALYSSMLELAGRHSRHIYRFSYVYNYRDYSEWKKAPEESKKIECRIRNMKYYHPLNSL